MVNLQHIPSHLQHSSRTLRNRFEPRRWLLDPWPLGQGNANHLAPASTMWLSSNGCDFHGRKNAMKMDDAMDGIWRDSSTWTNLDSHGQYTIYIYLFIWNTPSRLYDSFVRESCHVSWWNIPITSISYDTSFGNFSGRPTVDFLQKLAGLSRWFITPFSNVSVNLHRLRVTFALSTNPSLSSFHHLSSTWVCLKIVYP